MIQRLALSVLTAAAHLGCGGSDSPASEASAALAPNAPGMTSSPAAGEAASGSSGAAAAATGGEAAAPDGAPLGPVSPLAAGSEALSAALAGAVERGDAPAIVALVVDRDGVLFEGAAGPLSAASGAALPVDAIFNIASMTKPVTSVAVMMLLEQGMLELDDPVSTFLPEFGGLEVITSPPDAPEVETAPAETEMTVRHLLSHTSGIGYGFANPTVARLQAGTQLSELELPLLNEPGARWNYSASTRVLGLIVEELSGQSLEDFFQENIFEPLGMQDTSYAVPPEKQARLPALHARAADGSLQEQPQLGAPAAPTPPFTGDGGLYSTARDYGQLMRMFLNGGELDGVRILSEGSVQLMGENQIGDLFVEEQETTNPGISQPFPLGAGVDKFGLGFQITGAESPGGRSVGSLSWAGIFNTEFWIDPVQGIAATHLVQVLPFYDAGALRALADFEAAVYDELVARPSE